MTYSDKIFYTLMLTINLMILGLMVSIFGCTGPLQNQPGQSIDRAMDPCELEFWEDEEFAESGR
tara:strand:- start:169 stop:360 length:192 start_codon:yes stop_codon:yes gene_type:complete